MWTNMSIQDSNFLSFYLMSFFYSRILSYSGDHMRIAVIHIRLVWAVKVSQPTLVFDDFQIFPGSQSGILQNAPQFGCVWMLFLMIRLGLRVLGKGPQRRRTFLCMACHAVLLPAWPTRGSGHLHLLVKGVSVRFLGLRFGSVVRTVAIDS